MTWHNRAYCPDCDPAPRVRPVEIERVETAANGVVVHYVKCADCGAVLKERLSYDESERVVGVEDFSWLTESDVVTPDDVRNETDDRAQ